jgi:hypothetical protein
MIGIGRSVLQDAWSAARAGLARLNRALADPDNDQDMVFHIHEPRESWRPDDTERLRRIYGGRDDDPEETSY